jgi:cytochrome b561
MSERSLHAVPVEKPGAGNAVVTYYSRVAVVLHWMIALLILTNIVLAWVHDDVARETSARLMLWHKSTGTLVLLLSFVRLGWRVVHPAPPYPAGLPRWERISSRIVHWGFYVIMIGMPLTGWVMTSGPKAKAALLLYGVVPWPMLGFVHDAHGQAAAVWHTVGETHSLLAYLAYALIVLHVGAASKHQFYDRDVIMARMLPFIR